MANRVLFVRGMRLSLVFWLCVACTAEASHTGEDTSRLCNESGHACTWAGVPGQEGFNGDGHAARQTQLYWPFDVLFASDLVPWFIDWNNHLVRRIEADGTVRTAVGWVDPVFPGDGSADRAEWTEAGALGTDVQLNHPTDLLEAADGNILIMAWHNHKLRRVDPSSLRVNVVCGDGPGFKGDGGPAKAALFKQPKAMEMDGEKNLYVLDQQNFRIRRIDVAGTIETIAGGTQGEAGDGGPAVEASLGFAAGSNPEPSGGLAYAAGKLFFSDTLSHRVRYIDLEAGTMHTLAGTGERGRSGDGGPALEARLDAPRDLELGPDGRLYVADTDNSVIRAIDLESGRIERVVGIYEAGLDEREGLPARETPLRRPFGIAFDEDGALYVADSLNSRILRVAP